MFQYYFHYIAISLRLFCFFPFLIFLLKYKCSFLSYRTVKQTFTGVCSFKAYMFTFVKTLFTFSYTSSLHVYPHLHVSTQPSLSRLHLHSPLRCLILLFQLLTRLELPSSLRFNSTSHSTILTSRFNLIFIFNLTLVLTW